VKNFILLVADEMRADAPGYMGNPDCHTPQLDSFAEHSIVFENHFAVHGKCIPSRIAMLTGRYSHTDGFRTINQHLPSDHPNLLQHLRQEYGYETAVFGLNHTWETLFDTNEVGAGISDYHSFTGHYHDMAFAKYSVPDPDSQSRQPLSLDPDLFEYGGRLEGALGDFCDDARTDQAIDYLTKTRDRRRPFYLQLNLSQPHPPYAVEEPYFSMYDRETIRAWPHELPKDSPLPMRVMRAIRTGLDTPPKVFREIQAVYYGMISKVDVLLGRVLDTLAEEGLMENSVVLFTSDHADFAGQYGLIEKWDTCMNDCILHVPFILWSPDLPQGRRMQGLSEHVDVVPTVLDLLGLDRPPHWGIHGESLLPILSGERRKTAVFADGGHEQEMWARFNFEALEAGKLSGKQQTYQRYPESMARTKMVRSEDWKLVMRLAGGNELYDLRSDPDEMNNLWNQQFEDAALMRVVAGLQQQLIEWCLRTDTDRPYQERVGA
jgi:arylsulfatase A-like enzyme